MNSALDRARRVLLGTTTSSLGTSTQANMVSKYSNMVWKYPTWNICAKRTSSFLYIRLIEFVSLYTCFLFWFLFYSLSFFLIASILLSLFFCVPFLFSLSFLLRTFLLRTISFFSLLFFFSSHWNVTIFVVGGQIQSSNNDG